MLDSIFNHRRYSLTVELKPKMGNWQGKGPALNVTDSVGESDGYFISIYGVNEGVLSISLRRK